MEQGTFSQINYEFNFRIAAIKKLYGQQNEIDDTELLSAYTRIMKQCLEEVRKIIYNDSKIERLKYASLE